MTCRGGPVCPPACSRRLQPAQGPFELSCEPLEQTADGVITARAKARDYIGVKGLELGHRDWGIEPPGNHTHCLNASEVEDPAYVAGRSNLRVGARCIVPLHSGSDPVLSCDHAVDKME